MTEPEATWLLDPTIPEPIKDALRRGQKFERITLDSEGNFWHEGELLDDPRICELFHRSIQRTAGGSYLLVVPPFSYPLTVIDVPYWVTQVRFSGGEGTAEPLRVRLRLSDGSEEDLAFDTLRYEPRRGFVCLVKGRSLPARFSRPCYFALAEHVEEEDDDDSDAAYQRSDERDSDDERYDGPPRGRLSLVLGSARYPIRLL